MVSLPLNPSGLTVNPTSTHLPRVKFPPPLCPHPCYKCTGISASSHHSNADLKTVTYKQTQIRNVYTERFRWRQKFVNNQNQSVFLFIVQLWVKRRQEAGAALPGNHGFTMTAQAQPQMHRQGTSGIRKEAAVETEPEEREQRFRKAPAEQGIQKELLIWRSEGGIDFLKTYGRIQQVQIYQGAQSPPLAPAGATTRSSVTSHSCWDTPRSSFTPMGAASTLSSSPAPVLLKSWYAFTDGRAAPVARWTAQTAPLQISYKMLISFYCSSFGGEGKG